tara:strand:- start:1012 stop:1947 length:936 start_codon:yes stop_codon:yes gene_type:complete
LLVEKKLDLQSSNVEWLRLEQVIPFELEDSLYWLLKNLGINRFSLEQDPNNRFTQKLFIWLPISEWTEIDQEDLVQSIISLAKPFKLTLPKPKWDQVKDEDWSLNWKKNWRPDSIGKSILILPVWLDIPAKYLERKIIRLDPGIAFGTGSHPSTRLCIEALDNDPPVNKTIADLGCGSGILSLTALKLGAKRAFAVDTDPLAISATKINSALNNYSENLFNVFLGSIGELEKNIPETKIDLMLCNILAPVIKSLGPDFKKILGYKGKVILSGLLVEQLQELQEFFSPLGWEVVDIQTKDHWALMELTQNLS